MSLQDETLKSVPAGDGEASCEMELKLSRGTTIALVSTKLFFMLIPQGIFIVYVYNLAWYKLEHWYYFPFAAQFWWGIILLFLVGFTDLVVGLIIVEKSVKRGTSMYVPKGTGSCRRCGHS